MALATFTVCNKPKCKGHSEMLRKIENRTGCGRTRFMKHTVTLNDKPTAFG